MNTSLLCLMAVAAAGPAANPDAYSPSPLTVHRPTTDFEAAIEQDDVPPIVVRGQSSSFLRAESMAPPTYQLTAAAYPAQLQAPTYSDPGVPGTIDPYGGSALPPTYQPTPDPFGGGSVADPWIGGGGLPAPNANPYGPANPGLYTYGCNGAQPYRFGWSARYDFGILADEGTTSPFGSLGGWGIMEVDTEKELITPIWNNYIFGIAPQFNYRSWEGPSLDGILGPGAPGFSSNMYRLGLGLKLATPDYAGWNFEVGFNPGYATDFQNTDFEDAMQWDGHAIAFWRMKPDWMWAFGAAYWDRVDNIVIPNAGAVWTPNDIWEFRLIFPQPRISMFLGTPGGVPTWAYVRGEYHVESYAVELEPGPGIDTQIQIKDWRVLGGVRTEAGAVSTFAEVGWVFERDAKLDIPGLKAQIHSGLIGRVGLRY